MKARKRTRSGKGIPVTVVRRKDGSIYSSERIHDPFVQKAECREKCTQPTADALDVLRRRTEGKGRTKRRDNGPKKGLI